MLKIKMLMHSKIKNGSYLYPRPFNPDWKFYPYLYAKRTQQMEFITTTDGRIHATAKAALCSK